VATSFHQAREEGRGGLGIEFHNIEKRYGARFALRGVSLQIAAGECVALLGANGSGKSTLLKIAALLVRPTSGGVTFSSTADSAAAGAPPAVGPSPAAPSGGGQETFAIKARIGLLAHQTLLYDELSAEENLVLFAKLYGLDRPLQRAAAALEPAGLARRGKDLVRTFSRGMRQRLAIARATLAAPALLLLDEPAAGLDPAGQQWLGKTLGHLQDRGCTMLMSTHGTSEAHAVVTRAVRLAGGQIAEDSGAAGDPRPILAAALAAGHEG
jgi:heme exporter protein A